MGVENLEAEVRGALADIMDPETGLSIMRMELIHDLTVASDGSVNLIFRPSSPVCPMAYSLAASIKNRLEAVERVNTVKITVENFEKAAHLEAVLQAANSHRKVT